VKMSDDLGRKGTMVYFCVVVSTSTVRVSPYKLFFCYPASQYQ
jgi:hypothetical protein